MKKILVIGLISGFFSVGAFAAACPATSSGATIAAGAVTGGTTNTEQCVCDGGKAIKNTVNGGSTSQRSALTTPIFVLQGFDVQCSANTLVSYNEVSPTGFAVGSGSRKGNQAFKGSTAGGGIAAMPTSCPASGCTATEVTAANLAATADAGT